VEGRRLDEGNTGQQNACRTQSRSPQGATVSPLLANVYLHYVFDLWVQQWRTRHATGEVIVVRYADDAVLGFQHQSDAERFARDLEQRLAGFGLTRNTEKTRLIRFGRYAAQQRAERGLGRPETFEFLGFTHYCWKTKDETFCGQASNDQKRMTAKLKEVKASLMIRRHWPIEVQGTLARRCGAWTPRVLLGDRQHPAGDRVP
jgi:RNA-directed DNA polymerase